MKIVDFLKRIVGGRRANDAILTREHGDETDRDQFAKEYNDQFLKHMHTQFEQDSEELFEIVDLMFSLQGWCLNKMLSCKTERARSLLQNLNDWAEDKDWMVQERSKPFKSPRV